MDDERAHRERLRKEYRRRLRLRELQAARQGDTVDPAVLADIEELKISIAALDVFEQPQVKPEVMELLARQDEVRGTTAAVTGLGIQVNDLRKAREEDRADSREWRESLRIELQDLRGEVSQVVRSLLGEHSDRVYGQRLNRALLIGIAVALVVLALMRVL